MMGILCDCWRLVEDLNELAMVILMILACLKLFGFLGA